MYFLINELSFANQFSDTYDVDQGMDTLKNILQELKFLRDLKLITHQGLGDRELYSEFTVRDWLRSYSSKRDKDRDFLILFSSFLKNKCISETLDEEFKNGLYYWECYFNEVNHFSSSLAGAAYLEGNLVSIQKSGTFDTPLLTVHFKRNEEAKERICIHNLYEVDHARKLRPQFIYHPKHDLLGHWHNATPMNLNSDEAQEALEQSVPYVGHTQRFSLYKDTFYEFKSDNSGGYPVDESKVPSDIRKLLADL